MVDYREEVRIGKEILARVVEAYRKLRNTLRYLVANLYDFDPARDAVPVDRLEGVDRFALSRYARSAERMLEAYDRYDFPTVFQTLNALATVDLSAFYVDVTKDRMYTLAAASPARRSTQTVMHLMADGLARLLAPILPVTAEDLWRNLPGQRSESVHLERFPDVAGLANDSVMAPWERLLAVRADVNAALEEKRQAKEIGTSLSARVSIAASGPVAALLERHRDDLPMLFIVSEVELTAGAKEGADEVRVTVSKAGGVKCDRCWRFVPAVRTEPEWAGICDRCLDALGGNTASLT